MKKVYLSALALAVLLSGTHFADAKNYKKSHVNKTVVHQGTNTMRPADYDANALSPEAQKYVYNGSSAYRGGIAGQVAYKEATSNGTEMVVRPVRGAHNQFNASLRNGDIGQSKETRLNHAFNN